jgi:formamidase
LPTRLTIDPRKRCAEEEDVCHNRWHPDIKPAIEVEPGEVLEIETRDALDGQITDRPGTEDLEAADLGVVHPLTGPVYVKGAEPGDLLVVEVLEVEPLEPFGYTVIIPGFGFLRDLFKKPFKARWRIEGGYAISPDVPGVRIPGDPFLGVMGVAPSRELMERARKREEELRKRGGFVLPPTPRGAVPSREPIASEGLRTIPPRENGGNLNVRYLSPGSRIYLPVFVEGALFSAGDAHFAQGDGEVTGTAIEIRARAKLRFHVVKEGAKKYGIRYPVVRPSESSIRRLAYSKYVAPVGLGIMDDRLESENATLSSRQAIENLIDLLERAGYTREQAYIIASLAADLRLAQVVDVPSFTGLALLPLDIFVEPPELLRKLAGLEHLP